VGEGERERLQSEMCVKGFLCFVSREKLIIDNLTRCFRGDFISDIHSKYRNSDDDGKCQPFSNSLIIHKLDNETHFDGLTSSSVVRGFLQVA
jgi:hypothetical protein